MRMPFEKSSNPNGTWHAGQLKYGLSEATSRDNSMLLGIVAPGKRYWTSGRLTNRPGTKFRPMLSQ